MKSSTFASAFTANGSVAQLDRVPDYGSGGSRFEPWRGHNFVKMGRHLVSAFLLKVSSYDSMSKVCNLTGKKPISGNNVSHSNRKTKRRFVPNIQKKRFFVPELGKFVTLRVSANAIRTINKLGLINYLKKLEAKGIDHGVKL